jgi:hypothetical protein
MIETRIDIPATQNILLANSGKMKIAGITTIPETLAITKDRRASFVGNVRPEKDSMNSIMMW